MEAVIIAAGMGTRLGPIGQRIPKCMLEINGKPLIQYQLDALRRAGFNRITLVTGHLSEAIQAYCRSMQDVRVVYNSHYPMTGGAFSFLCGVEDLHDDVLYLICDMLYEPALVKRLSMPKREIAIGVQLRPTGLEDMKIVIQNGIVTKIGKSVPLNQASGEFLGAAWIPAQLLPVLTSSFTHTLSDSKKRAFHFGNALNDMIQEGAAIRYTDLSDLFWCEIDTPEDLEVARLKWGMKSEE